MPETRKIALWAGAAAFVLVMVFLVAKTVLPFTIGLVCGSAAMWLWNR